MKHRYFVNRIVMYQEVVDLSANNKEEAERLAQEIWDNDYEDDRIEVVDEHKTCWVAQLDEEQLVEDLLNVPQSKVLDDVVDTMFEAENED